MTQQPTATTFEVSDLVEAVLAGQMRIPAFQRGLRWQQEDVRRLFDSIVRGYPIGSLLLWKRRAKADTLQLGPLTIEAPAFEQAYWVVDGQQRLTSLASALHDQGHRDPRFALVYDLDRRQFDKPRKGDYLRLPLPVLSDLQRLVAWLRDHPEATEHFDEATRVAKLIRQFKVPAYVVTHDDEQVLRDIFDRMNNYGKRLSRAEVFSALHSVDSDVDRPRDFSEIAEDIDARLGFGLIDDDTVLRAFLARRGADVTRDVRTEFDSGVRREFSGEAVEEAHRGAQKALERTVHFLQSQAGIPHFTFLPYRYLLVVLARLFAHHPEPSQRNLTLLRRWFWRAAMIGPAIAHGSHTSAMRTLGACIDPEDETESVAALLHGTKDHELGFEMPRFKSTTAAARFALCALWALEPRSVTHGQPYDQRALADALREQTTARLALSLLLPRAPNGRVRIGNRVILLEDDVTPDAVSRLAVKPEELTEVQWHEVLRSHALTPAMAADLDMGRATKLMEARDQAIILATQRFLARMSESDFEDTPPLSTLDLDPSESEEEPASRHAGT